MKIGIIGNCYAPGMALAIKQLRPNDTVIGIEAVVAQRKGNLPEIIDLIMSCDLVWMHKLHKGFGALEWEEFTSRRSNVTQMPSTAFTGFHPDSIYVSSPKGTAASPLGSYHSGIVAAVYALGGSVDTALQLFTPDVFQRLGYFDEFEKARIFIQKEMLKLDVDIRSDWEKWMLRAPFMHTINHPKPIVVATIAKAMAANAGLVSSSSPIPTIVYDGLANHPVWPIYPVVSDRLGLVGNYLFKKAGIDDPGSPTSFFIGLNEFVEQSFLGYEKYDRAIFKVPSVERISSVLKEMI